MTYYYWGDAQCPGSGFTPGGPHAVCKLSDPAGGGAGGTQFGYDLNGNMVKEKKGSVTKDYIFDTENRLIRYKKNGTKLEDYEYDGDGGRVKKIKYTAPLPGGSMFSAMAIGGGVDVTRYVGSLYDEADTGTLTTRQTRYVFLGDQRIASITPAGGGASGQVLYYLHDHLGGTNLLTDSTGATKELMEYEPYGQFSRHETLGTDEEVAWYYFTGKMLDDTTGLMYFGARYYHPKIGRFMSADTIVPYFDDSQSFNRYTYVRNNPVNLVDDDGHFFFAALIGALIGGITNAALGQDFTQGLITGAIGGTVFSFVGALQFEGGMQILAHTLGGGASGALGGLATGGDVGMGAAIGAVSAGLTEAIGGATGLLDAFDGDTWGDFAGNLAARSVIGGVVGGATSAAFGGDFLQGFSQGALTAGVAFTANHGLHDVGNWLYENVLDGKTIEQGLDLAKNANYKTIEGWIEGGVGVIGAAALVVDKGFDVATLGIRGGLKKAGAHFLERVVKNNKGFARIGGGKSSFQLNRLVQNNKAPKSILRFDGGSKEILHVHFSDGTAIYANGTYKHGSNHVFTSAEVKFLNSAGFNLK